MPDSPNELELMKENQRLRKELEESKKEALFLKQSHSHLMVALHSDQGSQYTSKDFIEYCASSGITQSMSKAGYPYDNAPMERYFNTLKSELIYLHYYHNDEELNASIEEFAYVTYNHIRPHSYNGYKTPFEARYASAK